VSSPNPKTRVAFQGERGAFSEEAAVKLLGDAIELVPRQTFAALFSSFDEGVADYLLAPIANSIAGPVEAAVALLNKSGFTVVDEVTIHVAQNLIGCRGVKLSDIEEVQSHPMALAQCTRFFIEHPRLKQIEGDDTAGSVAEIIQRRETNRAAIAARRAAEIYGGVILQENIQDASENLTRFVLLSKPTEKDVKP